MKKSQSRKVAFLNALGSLGYVACFLQWLWVLLIFLPSIVDSPFFRFFVPTGQTEQPVMVAQTGSVPLFVTVLALIVGICIVVGSMYIIFVKIPHSAAKAGEVVTHRTATAISPIITRHAPPLSAKQRRTLPATIIVSMKLLFVFLPLCLLIFADGLTIAISFDLIILIGVVLFSWAFLLFAVQFALSQLLRVDYKTIR